jgi:hypothetical protein
MWSGLRAMRNVSWNPSSFANFIQIVTELSHETRVSFWSLFAAQSWALWHIWNKIAIEKSFPNQPADWVFKTLLFLQQWWPLLRSKDNIDVEIMEELLRKLYQDTYSPPAA